MLRKIMTELSELLKKRCLSNYRMKSRVYMTFIAMQAYSNKNEKKKGGRAYS